MAIRKQNSSHSNTVEQVLNLPKTAVKEAEDGNPGHTEFVLGYFAGVDTRERRDGKRIEALEEEDESDGPINAGFVGTRSEHCKKFNRFPHYDSSFRISLPLIIPPMA